jgi:predicted acyltransferase
MENKFFSQMDLFMVTKPGQNVSGRIAAVDALRGFDLFWIIGAEAILKSPDRILHTPATGFISTQLTHVTWTGFRFYDLIMPLFLFIVGVSMPFSFKKRIEKEGSPSALWPHIIKRVVILWILGMAVQGNLLSLNWSNIKFYSNTLQAIASGYLISSILILYLRVPWQVIGTGLLLIIYWTLLTLAPVPGYGPGVITPEGNFAIYIDKLVFGIHQDGTTYSWIISSLNFGATTMLGVFSGYLLQSGMEVKRKSLYLAAAGAALILLGSIWHIWFPSVKHIWTSSFVLFSGGICLLSLSLFLWLIDGLNLKRGFSFFTVIGMNAIFAYCAAHLYDFGQIADVVFGGLKQYCGEWYRLIHALGGFGVLYFILWLMYRYRIFIKI